LKTFTRMPYARANAPIIGMRKRSGFTGRAYRRVRCSR
jgi:hypothetical protein